MIKKNIYIYYKTINNYFVMFDHLKTNNLHNTVLFGYDQDF